MSSLVSSLLVSRCKFNQEQLNNSEEKQMITDDVKWNIMMSRPPLTNGAAYFLNVPVTFGSNETPDC